MEDRVQAPPRPAHRAQAGFTILELVIALAVLALVLVAMLALFDATNKLSRAQINVAETQQSVRIGHDEMVRMTRMAARGWELAVAGPWTSTAQVSVTNNVGASAYIDNSTNPELKILPGTDVLRIRGVINGSIFSIGEEPAALREPEFQVYAESVPGFKNDLDQLDDAEDAGNAFKMLAVTRVGGVVLLDARVDTCAGADTRDASLRERIGRSDSECVVYNGVPPESPIVAGGIVEEYAFYIRENDGNPTLSLARFQPFPPPGPPLPYGGDPANFRQDIADGIIDLQVALGIDTYTDTNGNGVIDAADRGDRTLSAAEWFLDAAGDPAPPELGTQGDLHYVRITTLGRTAGRDLNYVSPPIAAIEDHVYNEPAVPTNDAEAVQRSHRRRRLTTTVDTRNM